MIQKSLQLYIGVLRFDLSEYRLRQSNASPFMLLISNDLFANLNFVSTFHIHRPGKQTGKVQNTLLPLTLHRSYLMLSAPKISNWRGKTYALRNFCGAGLSHQPVLRHLSTKLCSSLYFIRGSYLSRTVAPFESLFPVH